MSKAPPKTQCACGCREILDIYWIQVNGVIFKDVNHYAKYNAEQTQGVKRFNAEKEAKK